MFFYGVEKLNMVLGTAPRKQEGDKVLGLDEWIITLEGFRTLDMGARLIKDDPFLKTCFRLQTTDSDQTSGYPSDTVASGLSKATTEAEILRVSGVDKTTMKDNNMNLIYGDVNHVRYCVEMYNYPSMRDLYTAVNNIIEAKKNTA